MDSKRSSCFALFLSINLLFFALVSGCNTCSKPHPPPKGTGGGGSGGGGGGGSGGGGSGGGGGGSGGGSGGGGSGGGGSGGGGGGGGGGGSTTTRCPRDALKLGVCANLLNGAIGAIIGTPPVTPCCSLLQGLVDLEVAVCLCTALRANILGINLNIPISLSLLLNICGNRLPPNFQC